MAMVMAMRILYILIQTHWCSFYRFSYKSFRFPNRKLELLKLGKSSFWNAFTENCSEHMHQMNCAQPKIETLEFFRLSDYFHWNTRKIKLNVYMLYALCSSSSPFHFRLHFVSIRCANEYLHCVHFAAKSNKYNVKTNKVCWNVSGKCILWHFNLFALKFPPKS